MTDIIKEFKEFKQEVLVDPKEILNGAIATLNKLLNDFCVDGINRNKYIVKKKKVHLRYNPPNPVWISGINLELQSVFGLTKYEIERDIKFYSFELERQVIGFVLSEQVTRLADTFFVNIDIDNYRYNHDTFQEVS